MKTAHWKVKAHSLSRENVDRKEEGNMDQYPAHAQRRNGQLRSLIMTAGIFMGASIPSMLADIPEQSNAKALPSGARVESSAIAPKLKTLQTDTFGDHVVSAAELERAVTLAARQHHVHPALLFAVMKAESSFNPIVVSKAGAVGLMQLIPETAMRHGVRNLYDTNENVAGGARHLRYLLDRFHGNTRLALAAYNAGERKVDRYKQIPPYRETRHYVQKVLSYYRDYRKGYRLAPLAEAHHDVYRIRTL
jgi:soluble lytic murein transglycosylase